MFTASRFSVHFFSVDPTTPGFCNGNCVKQRSSNDIPAICVPGIVRYSPAQCRDLVWRSKESEKACANATSLQETDLLDSTDYVPKTA